MPFQTINTTDKDLQKIQDNVTIAVTTIETKPFMGGVLLEAVTLASGSNQIAHTLQRRPRIWVICDSTAAATIYRTASDSNFLTLQSNAACTVSLWVA